MYACDLFWLEREPKGPGEQGATRYCPNILLLKRAKMVLCPFHRSLLGKSALEIGQFLRRNFWMISPGPSLSQPLCFTAEQSDLNQVHYTTQRKSFFQEPRKGGF